MKFYLGSRSNEVHVLTSPELTRCKNETLDSMSVTLLANDDALPYAPKQNFIIDMETSPSQVLCFIVESDTVKVFSTSPLKYQHTLSLIEKKKMLQYHLVRNSVFSIDPGNYQKQIFTATASSIKNGHREEAESGGYYWTYAAINNSWTNPSQKALVGGAAKATAYITYQANFFYWLDDESSTNECYTYSSCNNDFQSIAEINNKFAGGIESNFTFSGNLQITYTDAYGVQQSRTATMQELGMPITEQNIFNNKVKCTYINNLLRNGAKDISIKAAGQYPAFFNCDGVYATRSNVNKPLAFNCIVIIDLEYPQTNKNCYEVLDLLVKRQRKDTSKTQATNTDLFNLPDETHYPELYNLLNNTLAPNFYFSQATMYECVAEIFKLFDATFTIDEDNYINIEYYNEKTSQINIDNQIIGINQSLSADKFSNGIVAYYQDARTLEVFPSETSYAKPRSQALGVPNQADHCILLPHNIHQIKKALMELTVVRVDIGSYFSSRYQDFPCSIPLEITDWVVEQSVWSGLSTASNYEYNLKKQNNTISYTKGGNSIALTHTYNSATNQTYYSIQNLLDSAFKTQMGAPNAAENEFDAPQLVSAWYNANFRIGYYTSVDGTLRVESLQNKYNGDMMVNQSNGAVDLNKMGLNMLGIAMKTGEPEKTITITLRSWADRIDEGSYTNDGYVADVVNYTFLEDGKILERIKFVKNFNALSQRIQVLHEKRLTNIASDLIAKSEDILTDYIYFSKTNWDNYQTTGGISILDATLWCVYTDYTFTTYTYNRTIAYALMENAEEQEVARETINKYLNKLYIPLVKYGAGNCICLELSYTHPINAGNYTLHSQNGWWGTSSYFTGASFYTNRNGEFEKCKLSFYSTATTSEFDQYFPNVDSWQTVAEFNITDYKVYKQPNEIFAVNIEFCVLAKDIQNEFVGSDFINNHGIITKNYNKYYIYFSANKYDVLDKKVLDARNKVEITSTTKGLHGDNGKSELTFNFSTHDVSNMKSWAIGDENGNIYFAFNEDLSGRITSKTIYFYLTGNRRI